MKLYKALCCWALPLCGLQNNDAILLSPRQMHAIKFCAGVASGAVLVAMAHSTLLPEAWDDRDAILAASLTAVVATTAAEALILPTLWRTNRDPDSLYWVLLQLCQDRRRAPFNYGLASSILCLLAPLRARVLGADLQR